MWLASFLTEARAVQSQLFNSRQYSFDKYYMAFPDRPCAPSGAKPGPAVNTCAGNEESRAIRALRVSSAGKRALIRAENEERLYRDICEAVTDNSDYPLAWIALAEFDARKSVRIAASSGSAVDYLDASMITWADDVLGQGPVGISIRSGQITIINDSATDPRFLPWRERGQKFGFRSVTALPLRCNGEVLGTLVIYAKEPDAFCSEEIGLLEELAADLSYGLELRRARRSQARAEAALLEAAAEFRTFFDSTNDAIFVAGYDGRFLEVNQAACDSLGYERAELLAMRVQDIDAPESAALLPQRLAKIRDCGTACFESVQVRRDGTAVPVELNIRAVTYRQTPAVLAVARDMSERKKAEEDLKARTAEMARLRLEAENGNRAKSEFLANVSHEIRTPLNGILGFNGLLLASELTPEQRESADAVRASGEHLLLLIKDLLDLSRIEAGRLDFETIPFSIRECVEEAVRPLRPAAEQKGLRLLVDIGQAVPEWATGDPNRLRQILLNLAGNAVKFTESGTVAVRVAVVDDVCIDGNGDRRSLQFTVADTGIGIPESQKASIFEPFRQADGSVTRRFGGTGLGLTISSRIVAQMNGRMWLETREGAGSTFFFAVPLIEAERPVPVRSAAIQSARVRPANSPLSVLVGEDNSLNQLLIRRLMEARGHRVTVCDTGHAVVRARWKGNFDLILMDVQMPEMDGLEATRRIREQEAGTGSRIAIVAMTACAMAGDRDKCIRAGFDAYLPKPINVNLLDQVLAGCDSTCSGPEAAVVPVRAEGHGSRQRCGGSEKAVLGSQPGAMPPELRPEFEPVRAT